MSGNAFFKCIAAHQRIIFKSYVRSYSQNILPATKTLTLPHFYNASLQQPSFKPVENLKSVGFLSKHLLQLEHRSCTSRPTLGWIIEPTQINNHLPSASIIQHIQEIQDVIERLRVEDPVEECKTPLEAAKSDIKWRRRRMRRHRLLRWRKKYRHIVVEREKKKLANRKSLHETDLRKSWEMFGLDKAPPPLTPEEMAQYEKEWREEGVWNHPLTVEEYKSFAKISSIMKKVDNKW